LIYLLHNKNINSFIFKQLRNHYRSIIIGGGAAGLFATCFCEQNSTLILEKNELPGRKLIISGSGRCNITHTGDIEDFFEHYGDHHRFLKHALLQFNNNDLISFFNKNGLKTIENKNSKVFPLSDKATDVLDTLLSVISSKNNRIKTNCTVLDVTKEENVFVVSTQNEIYTSDKLLITTGGMSYPTTGSTGDGYKFAKSLGHKIVPPKPALTPVFIVDYKFGNLSGISLQETPVYLYRNQKKIREYCGDIVFTHKGLSGPGILNFSRFFQQGDVIKINLVKQNQDLFREAYLKSVNNEKGVTIQNFMKRYGIAANLIKSLLDILTINSSSLIGDIPKIKRNELFNCFCECEFVIQKTGSFLSAMTTAGGVSLDEVSSKTLESKLVSGLYFSGEVLDIDGDTGGYNLQAAFSTGVLAAKNLK